MAKKILLIDDEEDVKSLLKLKLAKMDCEIIEARDGKDGLAKVRAQKPDMVITDVVMPEMNGLEFYKELKKDEAFAELPVLVLTTRGLMEDCFLAMGAESFLPKPVATDRLLYLVYHYTGITLKNGQPPPIPEGLQEEDIIKKEPQGRKKAPVSQSSKSTTAPKCVVLFGYSEQILEEMNRMLKENGCKVTVLKDALKVIDEAYSHEPDLLVLQFNNDEHLGFLTDKIVYDLNTVRSKKTNISIESGGKKPYQGFKVLLYSLEGRAHKAEDPSKKIEPFDALLNRCLKEGCEKYIGPYQAPSFIAQLSDYL